MSADVQHDEHGRVKTWELSIPELRKPMVAILDCPERLFMAWHRQAIGICELLDENGHSNGFPPQDSLWEVREYRRVSHVEGYCASYEPVPTHGQRRDQHQEIAHSGTVTRVLPNIGIADFPAVTTSTPVLERWCEPCGEWQEQRGILEAAGLFGCPRCGGDWPDGPKGLPPAEEGTR
jgi:hypothetical protein